MRKRYLLTPLTYTQRMFFEYLLLTEMDKQNWYGIVFLNLWKTEGIISIQ
jgi:hypothetical protein